MLLSFHIKHSAQMRSQQAGLSLKDSWIEISISLLSKSGF